jgi:hypothetical protein
VLGLGLLYIYIYILMVDINEINYQKLFFFQIANSNVAHVERYQIGNEWYFGKKKG